MGLKKRIDFAIFTQHYEMAMEFSFPKKEHLKRQKLIKQIFSDGNTITVFPLKLYYVETPLPEHVSIQAGFSVAKRAFKHAVQRNRIKRLMREAYRLNKATVFNKSKTQYAFMFLYIGKKLPDFHTLSMTMETLLSKFNRSTSLK